jgi:hypothetical protein
VNAAGENGPDAFGAQIEFWEKGANHEANVLVSGTWAVTATNIT